MNHLKKMMLLYTMVLASNTWSADNAYWTVKATNGVMATASGTVALNIGSNPGKWPNPSASVWQDCTSNWIYFNKSVDGDVFDEVKVDRMMAIALAAQKTESSIRVSIKQDASGHCYTTQIYDLGRNVYDQ